jgi:hypothetical protein
MLSESANACGIAQAFTFLMGSRSKTASVDDEHRWDAELGSPCESIETAAALSIQKQSVAIDGLFHRSRGGSVTVMHLSVDYPQLLVM